MRTILLESGARRKRSRTGLAASLAIHGALIAFALTAGSTVAARTLEKPKAESIQYVEVPPPKPVEEKKVYVAPKKAPAAPKKAAAPKAAAPKLPTPPAPKRVAAAPAPAPAPVNINVPVITPPTSVPSSLPQIDANAITSDIVRRASDVASAGGTGKPGAAGSTTAESTGDVDVSKSDGSAWDAGQVDVEVKPIGREAPAYPESLRSSRVSGQVVVRYVVGTNGRVEMGTVEIVESAHDRFSDAVKATLRKMRFRPAEVRGTKVRQLVQQSFEFRLQG